MNAADEELPPEEMRAADGIIRQALNRLAEHVDSVTILVTKRREHGHNGTWRMVNGRGNFYARYGHAREWVLQTEEDMKAGNNEM